MATEKSGNWLFQCNPKRYDLASEIKKGRTDEDWAMNQHRTRISPEDRVFFWQTGPQAQLVAVGHVTSPVYPRERETSFGRFAVDIALDFTINPPLTREEVLKNKTLSEFRPFKRAQGTNFPIDDPAIIAELENKLEGCLVPISKPTPQPGIESSQQAVDVAIKSANREIAKKVQDYIAVMDSTVFEWLVRRVFRELATKT